MPNTLSYDRSKIKPNRREQIVLILRFGLEGYDKHSLAEIGHYLNVTRERVQKIEANGRRKMANLIIQERRSKGITHVTQLY